MKAVWELLAEHYGRTEVCQSAASGCRGLRDAQQQPPFRLGWQEIFVTGNDQRMVLSASFDNLGKGASGAAVQCLNLMMGCPEETGLAL